jgi:hypothetical protein
VHSGAPGDTISPYSLSTVTPQQLLPLQKASDVHHISIKLPAGLLLPAHGPDLQDAEMSFINWLHMSNLTSLYLVGHDGPVDGEDLQDIFGGWMCYWAKEEGVWMRIADRGDAFIIDTLTSELEESQCESRHLTYCMLSHFWLK